MYSVKIILSFGSEKFEAETKISMYLKRSLG